MASGVRVPAALVAIPLVAGCSAGLYFADSSDPALPLRLASASILTLVAAAGFLADEFSEALAPTVVAGCLLGGTSLGLTSASAAYKPDLLLWFNASDPVIRDSPVLLEGVLREDAAFSPAGVSLWLDAREIVDGRKGSPRRTAGGVRLTVAGVAAANLLDQWRAGRRVRLPAILRQPSVYGDPGVPDDVRALARRGVVLLGTVKSGSLVEIVKHGSVAAEAAAASRAWARRQAGRYVGRWSPQSAAIAIAILIGDRSALSDADERRLQEAGTYHVIAISGGNIAILAAILLTLLRVMSVPSTASAGLTIAALLFYGQIASGGASVSRAVTAACIYLGGRMLDQRGPPLNALAVAASVGLALSPLAAFDGGFILSFGATLGILVGVPRVVRAFKEAPATSRPRQKGRAAWPLRALRLAGRAAGSLFVATLCAEVALLPVSALFFSRITIAGLALNFLAIPLMTVTQAAAMGTLASATLSEPLGYACGYVTHVAASGLVSSAGLVDFAPWSSQSVVAPAWWLIAGYYTFCVLTLYRRSRRLGVAGIACVTALMLASPSVARPVGQPRPGMLRVVFLDVGQGDSTLVQLPGGRVLLVDTGGIPGTGFDIGERIVSPSLRAFGVRSIETLVLTHGDPDHIGGAPAMLRHFSPHQIWEGVPVPPHAGLRELADAASQSGISWRTVQVNDREITGGVEIRVLHPPPPDWERQRVRNEDSIVLDLRLGDVSIILPGDIGREAEQVLLPRIRTAAITIVKAPHHGSATSSTEAFISATHPSAVIFSDGRGNRFGHPAPVVVARYQAAKSLVFRTDEDGAIVLDTDGRTVTMTTWSGRKVTLRK